MAQDYPLEELSPRAFEQLTVALALKVLGHGVEAFGSGPDGGREATYTGPVNWSATTGFGADSWDGYVVLQAKQKETLGTPAQNASWLLKQVSEEFDSWLANDSKRGRLPQYIVFVTNARLSSVADAGGIDQINASIRQRISAPVPGSDGKDSLAARGLRAAKVWHRDQLNGLLTVNDGIRNAFKGMLTVGDILTRLGALGGLLEPSQFEPVLKAHAMRTLGVERWVNFSDAGGTTRQSVDEVIIDLKADGTRAENMTLMHEVIDRGDSVLKPSFHPTPPHLVLTGQPGSGKSTTTSFLTQMYRSGFAADESLTPTTSAIVDGTAAALKRINVRPPKNHRWPIRVNLAHYADELGPSGDKSLLRWLSERVTARAELDIKPHTLKRWIQHWPCLVVFDGLDEVTAPEVRPRVLDEIRTFVEEAHQDDADLLVVVTTRPMGYTEQIMPELFTQLDLKYLDAPTAISYGRHITSRRLSDDLDRRDQVISRFEKQASDATMLRLMKTPLQVLIMTLILEQFGVLPADRYQLFWRYFETIYQRESAKPTNLAPFLTEHRPAITDLHESVGLSLQIHAETSTDARSILTKAELRQLAVQRLVQVGHQLGPEVDRIADRIVQATTERLVLLVPAEDDGVSFEIRSLQELMAARALSNVTDEQLHAHLSTTAPSPHWRNTWVFVAGRTFAEGPDHRRNLVTEVVENVDKSANWPGWLCAIGPELAAYLLDDGLAARTPRWQRRLIDVALRALSGPVPQDNRAVAIGLSNASVGNDLMYIRNALKTAFAGTPIARTIAHSILTIGQFGAPIPEAQTSREKQSGVKTTGSNALLADLIEPQLSELGLSGTARQSLDSIVNELRDTALTAAWDAGRQRLLATLPAALPLTTAGLRDGEVGTALEISLGALGPENWSATAALGQAVWPSLARAPIGQELRSQMQVDPTS
ncbi:MULTISPECIES: NACHT domain-containing protein [Microbacterium]|uniref:NACHT domain-containing protein n=1 Tax=Microbacterium TaxID=33882 RepID=UPI000B12D5BC|nr:MULTISPECIES: hypothetical protein [Microbacterium]